MKVFTAQQMRDFDKEAVEKYGIPSIVLMENAALRVVEFLEAKFAPLAGKKIAILCGKGNNGGDGLAIARHLLRANDSVTERLRVFLPCRASELQGDASANARMLGAMCEFDDSAEWIEEMHRAVDGADVVLDALFGTGFKGEMRHGAVRQMLESLPLEAHRLVAVDVISGLNADTGKNAHRSEAAFTVTFAAPKRGLFLREGLEDSGEVWVGDIGTRSEQIILIQTGAETLDLETAQNLIPQRSTNAHKGDAGRALIIGGSVGMSGAVALAARAALNSGCGLCIAALPEKVLPIFAASILEATSHPLSCDEKGRLLERAAEALPELWQGVQVVALGPGIGCSEETFALVRRIVRECPVPLVIDADALHALPAIAEDVKNRASETVLTPHPGEMGELLGMSAREVNENRFESAEKCAAKYGAIAVLKGARTLVATPAGRTFVNLNGNSGMATGGSGDVLTGTIAGLLAQLKNAEDATKLGVYLHGYAGDLAFTEKRNGLVAGDIAAHLGRALVEIPQREVEKINGRLRKLE